MPDIFRHRFTPTDSRLGRHVEHDPRSKGFARPTAVDKSTWRDRKLRIIDPRPNPNQTVGNCTMCAKAMQLNSVGNRKRGRVLDMKWAMDGYVWETHNDDFPGAYNLDGSGQDTGSNGLASCKTAQHTGDGGEYLWLFSGADAVVQAIMDGDVVSAGTRWENDQFQKDSDGRIHLGGGVAGGHQYVLRGYWLDKDWVMGRCWWGPGFQDFWIARTDLDTLLHDNGDAHVQARA